MLHIKLKGLAHRAQVKHIICPFSLPQPPDWVKGSDIFFNLGIFHANYVSWSTSKIRVSLAPSNMLKPSSYLVIDRSKSVLHLWILFVICVSCLSCCLVFPCGHLLRKRWPLGSFVCDVFLCFCHFPIWCPGSGVVFDSIYS